MLLSGMRGPHAGVACESLLYSSDLSQSPGLTSLPLPPHTPVIAVVASLSTSELYAASMEERSGDPMTPPITWHEGHMLMSTLL